MEKHYTPMKKKSRKAIMMWIKIINWERDRYCELKFYCHDVYFENEHGGGNNDDFIKNLEVENKRVV